MVAVCLTGAVAVLALGPNGVATRWRVGRAEQLPSSDTVRTESQVFLGVSQYIAGYSSENGCPYETVALSESECRKMPDKFGGSLNNPFTITSPNDPAGCFGFRRWYYFNLHPIGDGRTDRRVYCKRSSRPMRFQRIGNGVCTDYGFLPVLTAATCAAAARDLGLVDHTVHTTNSSHRPEGCYYFANSEDSTGTLWLNINPTSAGRGAEKSPDGVTWTRQPLCVAQTTTRPPPVSTTGTITYNVSGSYIAGGSGANECPYGAVPLNESDCRRMPDHFSGELHEPLVIDSPGDPKGCFFFLRWYYFNSNSVGAKNAGRTPYCRLTGVALDVQGRASAAGGCGSACNPQAVLHNVTQRVRK